MAKAVTRAVIATTKSLKSLLLGVFAADFYVRYISTRPSLMSMRDTNMGLTRLEVHRDRP